MAKKAKKKAGRKPVAQEPKSVTVSVRLDPITKYALELAARIQRRSMSGVIEWAIDEAAQMIVAPDTKGKEPERSLKQLVADTWSANDFETFIGLAIECPELLSFEEQRMWLVIRETPEFWLVDIEEYPTIQMVHFDWKRVRKELHKVEDVVRGKAADSPVTGLSAEEVQEELGWPLDRSRPESIPF